MKYLPNPLKILRNVLLTFLLPLFFFAYLLDSEDPSLMEFLNLVYGESEI